MDPTKNSEWILWGKQASSTWAVLLFMIEFNWVYYLLVWLVNG